MFWIKEEFVTIFFVVSSCNSSFVSQVVTDILHLQGQKLHSYKGNYDTFEKTREEQLKNQQKAFVANERARSHMQVFYIASDEAAVLQSFICCFDDAYIS